MKTLVVMPTYNERENIANMVKRVLAANPEVDLLIADDNSPDGTGARADEIAATDTKVHVLHRAGKEGLGAAYLAGFAWAQSQGFEVVVEMDADGSHHVEDLPKMIDSLNGSNLVVGSRWMTGGKIENWPWYRVWLSKFGSKYARWALNLNFTDLTSGFRIYEVEFLKNLNLNSVETHGYSFQIEMVNLIYSNQGRVQEVPITFTERKGGRSKMTVGIALEALTWITKRKFKRKELSDNLQ